MIFGQNRSELRTMYREAWRKSRAGEILSPLEAQIAAVVDEHPEYQDIVASSAIDAEYSPDDGQINPFLHMGLHLAIRDQVSLDRPAGIAAVYRGLVRRLGDEHAAEHRMLETLGEALWEAQRANRAPDEQAYLERLKNLT